MRNDADPGDAPVPRQASEIRPNPAPAPSVSSPMYALSAHDPAAPPPVPRRGRGTAPTSTPTADVLALRPANDFDTLFAAHYERLVRTLSLVAGDADAAADAVQEAFVKAHLRWRTVSGYDDPIGWVRRVAINQIRDGHRRRVRKDRALLRLATRDRDRDRTAPVEIDEFDRLLATLPKQQRAATALFYVDGLSIAEIAVALDLAEGSVKSHLHDARRRLRPVLEREAAVDGRSSSTPPPDTSEWERP